MNIREELSKQGFKIRRTHYRRLRGIKGEFKDFAIRELRIGKQIEPRGGRTVVRLTSKDNPEIIAQGVSLCMDCDCYNRADGVKRALTRASEVLEALGQKRPDLSFLE